MTLESGVTQKERRYAFLAERETLKIMKWGLFNPIRGHLHIDEVLRN